MNKRFYVDIEFTNANTYIQYSSGDLIIAAAGTSKAINLIGDIGVSIQDVDNSSILTYTAGALYDDSASDLGTTSYEWGNLYLTTAVYFGASQSASIYYTAGTTSLDINSTANTKIMTANANHTYFVFGGTNYWDFTKDDLRPNVHNTLILGYYDGSANKAFENIGTCQLSLIGTSATSGRVTLLPASMTHAASYTLTFPAATPSVDSLLQFTSAGVGSWVAASGFTNYWGRSSGSAYLYPATRGDDVKLNSTTYTDNEKIIFAGQHSNHIISIAQGATDYDTLKFTQDTNYYTNSIKLEALGTAGSIFCSYELLTTGEAIIHNEFTPGGGFGSSTTTRYYTYPSSTYLTATQEIHSFGFSGTYNSTNTMLNASISIHPSQTWSSGAAGTTIAFYNMLEDTTTLRENFRIDGDGNIYIPNYNQSLVIGETNNISIYVDDLGGGNYQAVAEANISWGLTTTSGNLIGFAVDTSYIVYSGVSFYPTPNNTTDLGTSSLYWKDAYIYSTILFDTNTLIYYDHHATASNLHIRNATGNGKIQITANTAFVTLDSTTASFYTGAGGISLGTSSFPWIDAYVKDTVYLMGGTSGYVALAATTTVTDYTITLPNAAPGADNKILEFDASGTATWISTPSGGTSYWARSDFGGGDYYLYPNSTTDDILIADDIYIYFGGKNDGAIKWVSASDYLSIQSGVTQGSYISLATPDEGYIKMTANTDVYLYWGDHVTGSSVALYSDAGGVSLGTSTYYWGDAYITDKIYLGDSNSYVGYSSGYVTVAAGSGKYISLSVNSSDIRWDGTMFYPYSASKTLGGSANLWQGLFLSSYIYFDGAGGTQIINSGGSGSLLFIVPSGQNHKFRVTSSYDITWSGTSLYTSTTNIADLGSASYIWKDVYAKTLKLYGTTNAVTIDVDASTAAYSFTLPTSAGSSGQYLKTDGSGNTSWDTPSGSAIWEQDSVDAYKIHPVSWSSHRFAYLKQEEDSTYPTFALYRALSGPTEITSNQRIGTITFYGYVDDPAYYKLGEIDTYYAGGEGTTSYLRFFVATGTTIDANPNMMLESGLLTIGSTNRASSIAVWFNTAYSTSITKTSGSTPSGHKFVIPNENSAAYEILMADSADATRWVGLGDTDGPMVGDFGATKGRILYADGTNWTYLAPGTNGYVLTADTTDGIKWAAASGGSGGYNQVFSFNILGRIINKTTDAPRIMVPHTGDVVKIRHELRVGSATVVLKNLTDSDTTMHSCSVTTTAASVTSLTDGVITQWDELYITIASASTDAEDLTFQIVADYD